MKLVTDVTPRGDGTVSATVGATKYLFKAASDGRLTADVASEADALFLLDTGNFYPASEDDSPIVTAAAPGAAEAEAARLAEVARLESEAYAQAEAENKAAEEAEAAAKAEAKAKKDQAAADAKAAKAEAKKAPK